MDLKHRNQPPPCGTCQGSGKVYQTVHDGKKSKMVLVTCPTCGGRGTR